MTDPKKEFAVVGLGRMGGNLARQALDKGMRVVGFTRSGAPADLIGAGLVEVPLFRGPACASLPAAGCVSLHSRRTAC